MVGIVTEETDTGDKAPWKIQNTTEEHIGEAGEADEPRGANERNTQTLRSAKNRTILDKQSICRVLQTGHCPSQKRYNLFRLHCVARGVRIGLDYHN